MQKVWRHQKELSFKQYRQEAGHVLRLTIRIHQMLLTWESIVLQSKQSTTLTMFEPNIYSIELFISAHMVIIIYKQTVNPRFHEV